MYNAGKARLCVHCFCRLPTWMRRSLRERIHFDRRQWPCGYGLSEGFAPHSARAIGRGSKTPMSIVARRYSQVFRVALQEAVSELTPIQARKRTKPAASLLQRGANRAQVTQQELIPRHTQ